MRLVTKSIDVLIPAPYNPRKDLQPGDPEYEKLKKSILEFDYVDPVIWNERSGHVVGGHQRLKILKDLGRKRIQVSVVDLSEEKEKALNLALNKIQGEWDIPLLEDLLAEVEMFDFDDIEITGFSADEIAEMLRGNEMKAGNDNVPEPPEEPVTKLGDIWLLGEHRLMCGDSRNPDDVTRLMNGKKAILFSTDPPYLVDYTGADRPRSKNGGGGKDWSNTYQEAEIDDSDAFYRETFKNALIFLEDNAAWYMWHASIQTGFLQNIWNEFDLLFHQQIIWVKPTAVMGYSFYRWRHEPCMMGWKKGHKPKRYGTSLSERDNESVWELDWQGKARVVGNEHPTQKPVELFAIPMRKHTLKGDICFEPFCGSGSQIIAGEQLGRVVYAMEVSPIFVDVTIRRWKEFTGRSAKLEGEGKAYVQIAEEIGS